MSDTSGAGTQQQSGDTGQQQGQQQSGDQASTGQQQGTSGTGQQSTSGQQGSGTSDTGTAGSSSGSGQQTGDGQPSSDTEASTAGGDSGKSYPEDYVKRLRDENASHRTKHTEASKKLEDALGVIDRLKKALDPNAGEQADPVKVAETANQRAEKAEARVRELEMRQTAEKAARKLGADVDAMLDSSSVLRKIGDLDPASKTLAEDLENVLKEALEANPRFKAAQQQQGPPRSVTDPGGAPPASSGPKSIDDLRAERRKRRLG